MIALKILNIRYLCHSGAFPSVSAKLGIKNTPLFLFVSFLIIRKIIRRTYIFS